MFKKLFVSALLAVLSFQVLAAEKFVAGKHYEVLPDAVITTDKNKIEVVELFWYGCSHCFSFEPNLVAWKKTLPEDVNFVRMPAMWNKLMKTHAEAYYAAVALGVIDKVHQPIFNAINVDKNRLDTISALATLFEQYGVPKDKFEKTMSSFGVSSQVRLAESRAKSYRLQGTPELVVNGKYRISGGLAGGHEGMLDVASFLIEKERAAMASQ